MLIVYKTNITLVDSLILFQTYPHLVNYLNVPWMVILVTNLVNLVKKKTFFRKTTPPEIVYGIILWTNSRANASMFISLLVLRQLIKGSESIWRLLMGNTGDTRQDLYEILN